MLKCPNCSFNNEEGALFCEQCKEDLSAVASTDTVAVAEAIPVAEAVPMEAAAVAEAIPVDDTVPMAEAVPVEAVPEAMPVEVPAAAVAATPPAPPPPSAAPVPATPATPSTSVPPGATPKLVVVRGQKVNAEFPIYPELNFIGRADDKPVDIDLEDQEPPDRVWSSRQHAVIHFDEAQSLLTVEDLNSSNGTFVNRARIHPGQKRQLFVNDVIQIGNVHLKLKV